MASRPRSGVNYPTYLLDEDKVEISRTNGLPFIAAEAQRDAFGRLRVSEVETIFDSKLLYDKNTLFWDESVTNNSTSASSDFSSSSVVMTCGASDTIIRQTRMRFNYQSGKSQLGVFTGVMPTESTSTGRMGMLDGDNGLFFEYSSGTMNVGVRLDGVDTLVSQDNWNVDKMDGTGPSGVTADFSKAQIYAIDFEWLGVGRVRFAMFLNGLPWVVHEITHVNALTGVYILIPNLPARYELSVAAGGALDTMRQICSTVGSEGGNQKLGLTRSFSTTTNPVGADVADTIYAVVGVRLRSGRLAETNFIERITAMAETDDDFEWMLLFNPTIAGTFTYSAEGGLEVAYGATANTITEDAWELRMAGGFIKNTNQGGTALATDVLNELRLGATIGGTRDEIVLAVRPLTANLDVQATMTVREVT